MGKTFDSMMRRSSIMPLHGVRQRKNSSTWNLTAEAAYRLQIPLPSPLSDTWEKVALQITLDRHNHRFTLESLPNSWTFHKQVLLNWRCWQMAKFLFMYMYAYSWEAMWDLLKQMNIYSYSFTQVIPDVGDFSCLVEH